MTSRSMQLERLGVAEELRHADQQVPVERVRAPPAIARRCVDVLRQRRRPRSGSSAARCGGRSCSACRARSRCRTAGAAARRRTVRSSPATSSCVRRVLAVGLADVLRGSGPASPPGRRTRSTTPVLDAPPWACRRTSAVVGVLHDHQPARLVDRRGCRASRRCRCPDRITPIARSPASWASERKKMSIGRIRPRSGPCRSASSRPSDSIMSFLGGIR